MLYPENQNADRASSSHTMLLGHLPRIEIVADQYPLAMTSSRDTRAFTCTQA